MIAPLKKIVVCLDNTFLDAQVIRNACNLTKVAGTRQVHFLHVIRDFNLPESVLKEFPELLHKAIEERGEKINALVKANFECEVKTDVTVKQGNETKEILKFATDAKSDLIIFGRRKVSDSVLSTRIARRSPCNLLVIPEGTNLSFDKIIIPVDFSDYSDLSLKRTLLLTNDLQSKVFLQNVYTVPSSYRYSGKSYHEFAEIMKGHARKDLELMLKKVEKNKQELVPVFSQDKDGRVIELILKEAKKREVDLIVIGAKGRSTASALFIGSKAERMIRMNNEIPMMIIRKKGALAGLLETLKDL